MRTSRQLLALCLAVLGPMLGTGCGEGGFANPSGSCGTRANQGRAGYQAGGSDAWVPDCQNTLLREYWRVYSADGATAYMVPRPDGDPGLQPACVDTQSPLHAVVFRYELCTAATNSAQVAVVNAMDLGEALQVAHYLNGQLRFEVVAKGVGIQPYPIPSDILDACALDGGPDSAELIAMCARESERMQSGELIGFTYTGPGATALVARLNALYGIR